MRTDQAPFPKWQFQCCLEQNQLSVINRSLFRIGISLEAETCIWPTSCITHARWVQKDHEKPSFLLSVYKYVKKNHKAKFNPLLTIKKPVHLGSLTLFQVKVLKCISFQVPSLIEDRSQWKLALKQVSMAFQPYSSDTGILKHFLKKKKNSSEEKDNHKLAARSNEKIKHFCYFKNFTVF